MTIQKLSKNKETNNFIGKTDFKKILILNIELILCKKKIKENFIRS